MAKPPSESRIPQLNCGNLVNAVTSRIPFPGSKLLQSSRSIPRPTIIKSQPVNQENPAIINDSEKTITVHNPRCGNEKIKESLSKAAFKGFDSANILDQPSIPSWKLQQASCSAESAIKKPSLLKLPNQNHISNKSNDCPDVGNVKLKVSKFNSEFQLTNTHNIKSTHTSNDTKTTVDKNSTIVLDDFNSFQPNLNSTLVISKETELNGSNECLKHISKETSQSGKEHVKQFNNPYNRLEPAYILDSSSNTYSCEDVSHPSSKFPNPTAFDKSVVLKNSDCKYNEIFQEHYTSNQLKNDDNIKCSDISVTKEKHLKARSEQTSNCNTVCKSSLENSDNNLFNISKNSNENLRRRTFVLEDSSTLLNFGLSDNHCDEDTSTENSSLHNRSVIRCSEGVRTDKDLNKTITKAASNAFCKSLLENNDQQTFHISSISNNGAKRRMFACPTEHLYLNLEKADKHYDDNSGTASSHIQNRTDITENVYVEKDRGENLSKKTSSYNTECVSLEENKDTNSFNRSRVFNDGAKRRTFVKELDLAKRYCDELVDSNNSGILNRTISKVSDNVDNDKICSQNVLKTNESYPYISNVNRIFKLDKDCESGNIKNIHIGFSEENKGTLDSNKYHKKVVEGNISLRNENSIACNLESTEIKTAHLGCSEQVIGQRVKVCSFEYGILQYVGSVHFKSDYDVWCGVELDKPVGKHDGMVKGFRYFTCKPNHGILAPISKIEFVRKAKSNVENLKSKFESPVIKSSNSYILRKPVVVEKNVQQNPLCSQEKHFYNSDTENRLLENESGPFSILEIDSSINNETNTSLILNSSSVEQNKPVLTSENIKTEKLKNLKRIKNDSIREENNSKRRLTQTLSSNDDSLAAPVQTYDASPTFSVPSSLQLAKQNSFEFDESLGILTPDQMCEFPKTPSNDDLSSLLLDSKQSDKTLSNNSSNNSRTPSSENLGSLPRDLAKPSIPVNEQLIEHEKEESNAVLSDHKMNLEYPDSEHYESFISKPFKHSNELAELVSPNVADSYAGDLSLGLLDDEVLVSTELLSERTSSNLDTTINMDLPLDPIEGTAKTLKQMLRCEQTPSPEELPLDPIGLGSVGNSTNGLSLNPNTDSDPDVKTDATKSTTKTSSSFITSITSITSLDNGYQGDGEMSRPASRGGDHSPTVHKPSNQGLVAAINNQWQRAVSRRPDPMTDSDFFTESDADGHDENRRVVQIIDGQLYGMNAPNMQAGGEEIFVNNPNQVAEEMESSGIFTDLETNTRGDDLSDADRNRSDSDKVIEPMDEDRSPSDTSSKTLSENSQERNESGDINSTLVNLSDTLTNNNNENIEVKTNSRENSRNSSVSRGSISGNSSPSSVSKTPKKLKEDLNKKYRMPNRNVVSKIKSMLEAKQNSSDIENQENRKPTPKKNAGRWNAVMNKISDNKSKPNLKEVKSKVVSRIMSPGKVPSGASTKTVLGQSATNSYKSSIAPPKPKSRRTRTRAYENVSKSGAGVSKQASGSIHSSLSDISNSGSTLPSLSSKTNAFKSTLNRTTKKRDTSTTVTRCTSPPSNEGTVRSQQQWITSQGQQRLTRNVSTVKKNATTNNQSNATSIEIKTPLMTTTASTRRTASRRLLNGGSGAKNTVTHPAHAKDPNRVTGAPVAKGANGRQPTTQQQLHQQTQVSAAVPVPVSLSSQISPHLKHASLGVEALGVLVQHLVFNYDAFKTPYLKKDLENLRTDWVQTKLSLEEMKMGYRRLEDLLHDERVKSDNTVDEERRRYRAEIADIFEKQRINNIELQNKFTNEKNELEQRFQNQLEELKFKQENDLKEILIENDQLKSDYSKLKDECDKYRTEMEHLASDFDNKETELTQKLEKTIILYNELKSKFDNKEKELLAKLSAAEKLAATAEEEYKKVIESFKVETKDSKLQAALNRCTQLQDEAESLRTVLELKQDELAELRRAHDEAKEATHLLSASQIKTQALQARVEDLELQLERKTNLEKQLDQDKKILLESFQQEAKHKNRLLLHNEELQWKLKQNSEMINALLSRVSIHGSNQSLTDESPSRSPRTQLTRSSLQSASFSEKHSYSSPLERNASFRERYNSTKNNLRLEKKTFSENKSVSPGSKSEMYSSCFEIEDISPPSSPKIKAVVEKSDSVSYVLEIDESPEVLANRMYRRSFRNSTPPKSTPTKSPAPKRQKCKTNHPLSLSASATTISSDTYVNDKRSRSKSVSIKSGRDTNGRTQDFMSSSWNPDISSSSPNERVLDFRQEIHRIELGPSEVELDSLSGDIIIDGDLKHDDIDDGDVDFAEHIHMSLPALPSELTRSQKEDKKQDMISSLPSSGDLRLLQPSFPKNSAGEAMISESNSEDECSTSASSDRSHCLSDSEDLAKTAAAITQKTSKMQYELMVMTGSTNSETMDYSWSEEIDLMQDMEN